MSEHGSEHAASCGPGLAEHAALPAKLAELLGALAHNLELHLPALVLTDAGACEEQVAYRRLIGEYHLIASQLAATAKQMAAYRDLPAAEHDPAQLADPRLRDAFASYVALERELLTLLETAVARDERLLAG